MPSASVALGLIWMVVAPAALAMPVSEAAGCGSAQAEVLYCSQHPDSPG